MPFRHFYLTWMKITFASRSRNHGQRLMQYSYELARIDLNISVSARHLTFHIVHALTSGCAGKRIVSGWKALMHAVL